MSVTSLKNFGTFFLTEPHQKLKSANRDPLIAHATNSINE